MHMILNLTTLLKISGIFSEVIIVKFVLRFSELADSDAMSSLNQSLSPTKSNGNIHSK